MSYMQNIRATGFIVLITLALATTIFANEQNVHDGLHGQKNDSWLESDFVAEHSGKLKHLQWIIPVVLIMIVYYYLKRRCPECKKAWGLSYTGETENRASRWWAWLISDEYDKYQCKHCGYKEWKRSGRE